MGFMDYLSDLYDSIAIQSAEAEEPQEGEQLIDVNIRSGRVVSMYANY